MPPQVTEHLEGDEASSFLQSHHTPLDRVLWIFGYGSLIWKPDFEFTSRKIGFIRGYSRRFWHGDSYHRGNQETPGRVVTLLEDADANTWGVAYEVRDDQIRTSLEYLNLRESVLGGYMCKTVEFFPQGMESYASILALVYIATPQNPLYLGPAKADDIAKQIAGCSGHSGHNLEYLLRLSQFMHATCPGVEDEHLFSIEAAALALSLPLADGQGDRQE
ncbi:glutathione-specific gamma-glutamylcyclotransferase 1 [Carcharodon carcharias]|uniref:glutathione-specific gamma-glutamylcyclotransferase 1 n=1 Tax=Carcharodon carcharias TaxID=13397 RepID=UPI001B7EA632|nr:glutathione-specific gamma-glutamylcyclotransferase 1 [Carcharodon carcharias]